MRSLRHFLGLATALLILCACSVGPDYRKPEVQDIIPSDWHWKAAEPGDTLPKGAWWTVFRDPVLSGLESMALSANQELHAAVARVDKARAATGMSRSGLFPELALAPLAKRERTSGDLPTPIPVAIPAGHVNTFGVPFDLSYEVDLWGRVRRSFESAQARAQASAADHQNVLLTLTADVAVHYFQLRALEAETSALLQSVRIGEEMVRILKARIEAGAIAEQELTRARATLAGTRADLADTRRRQAETLHGLALLCGKPASGFTLAAGPMLPAPPEIPAGLPSSLLERRPDIAGAERILMAKNAEIGVAKAAYFPRISLTGQAGFLSAEADRLFTGSTGVWSISPGLRLPLFTAGRTEAEVKQAEAAYDEALAQYRQTILLAFKEVEDSLAQITLRSEETTAQAEALAAAERAADLARARCSAGAGSSLEVLDADLTRLSRERRLAQLTGPRFAATIRLVKSLGGGWGDSGSAIPRSDP